MFFFIAGLLLDAPIFSTKDDGKNIEKGQYRKSGRCYGFNNHRINTVSPIINKMIGDYEGMDLEGYGTTPGKEQTFYLRTLQIFHFYVPKNE
jgi:hypothetical protein